MTAGRRQLILRKQLANADEHQPRLVQPNEPHPAKADPCVAAGVIGKDDLIGRQGYPKAARKDDERPWRAVADDWKA